MKNNTDEIKKFIKSHINTRIIKLSFAAEVLLALVLLVICVTNFYLKGSSEKSFSDFFSRNTSREQQSYSEVMSAFVNHENNVKNKKENSFIIPTPSAEAENTEAINTPSAKKQLNCYKNYSFIFNQEDYSYKCSFSDELPTSGGICEDTHQGKLNVTSSLDLSYGTLLMANPFGADEFELRSIFDKPLTIPVHKTEKPKILIYYTHTSEGYCVSESEKYDTKDVYTDDSSRNVIFCGNIIENILKSSYNIDVQNDKTKNDTYLPDSYTVSADLLKKDLSENKDIDLVIDIHRDSAESGNEKFGPVVEKDGKKYSKIMFVMGTDSNGANKNWHDNMKLAMIIINKMESKIPGISRGISLRRDTYNSQYSNKAILTEIGFSGNLTEEVKNTAEIFANALGEIYSETLT